MATPPSVSRPSKLLDATQQKKRLPPLVIAPSKSTSYQARRRPSMAPTPTRTPSMTTSRRRNPAGVHHKPPSDIKLLPRLEEENANLPFQDSVEFILAQIERQNAMLDEDPKSVCIQSNELKAHLSTLQNLTTTTTLDTEKDDIDWEFWSFMTEDFGGVALKLPHLVSAKLRAGIPDKVRGVIWQAMSQSASLNLETMYGQLLAENSPYERIIQRDLARTFPHVEMFKQEGGDGQQALERILKAYSLYDSMVGYCQGLAFLVGPLLMNMQEQQSFCVFVRLMETYEMRSMFTLNMEGLQLRLYQFSSLLAQILPELSDHLAFHTVNAPMYASQWFLTLFAYAFPIDLVFRIYDIVFAEGAAETIMRVAIAMMKRSEDTLMEMTEFEDILDYVTTKLYNIYNDDPGMVITDAIALSGLITREKIDHLAELYVREQEEEKKQTEQVLAVRFNFWSKQPASPTPKAKKRESSGWLNKRTSSSSSGGDEEEKLKPTVPHQDIAKLHQQTEDLLLALSQLQTDHLQVKQELMQVRMDKMDIEAERDSLLTTVQEMPRHAPVAPKRSQHGLQKDLNAARHENVEIQQALILVRQDKAELIEQVEELRHENEMAKDAQTQLIEKLMDYQQKLDALEDVQEINERLKQRLEDANKVAQELQSEKIRLLNDLEQARQKGNRHAESEGGRRRPVSMSMSVSPYMDQSSAALRPIIRPALPRTKSNQRLEVVPTTNPNIPSIISVSTTAGEGRCRELEQMLAEAKLRIVELETAPSRNATGLTQPSVLRRNRTQTVPSVPSPLAARPGKARSVTSNSGPSSPVDPNPRRSCDQISQHHRPNAATASGTLSKRASFYGRFWSAIGQQDTPPVSPVHDAA
ncbi:rab-GTPase-TBC domain-containing protein [Phycomyces blakesleeanus]|uniref:Rab-GTPase-TBC domain-containing protein n=1 Tax=Phycomyces blakesleeanus TaxID=4837 RepID=A0ABR3AU04_PHYBL